MPLLLENDPGHSRKLKDVIHKLELVKDPLAIFSELDPDRISKKITNLSSLDEIQIIQDKKLLFNRLYSGHRQADDQYHLLAHLFLSTRKDIPSDKFDEKRERQNIDGVASLLVGNTKEINTGRGKSSVIAPTFLLFRSLWIQENNEPIIFSAPNNNLLDETINYYEKLKNKVLDNLDENTRYLVETKSKYIKDIKPNKHHKRLGPLNILTEPVDGLTEAYIEKIPIIFQTHNQAIFSLTNNYDASNKANNPPLTLFDEMHQLKDERFISTSKIKTKKPKVNVESFNETLLGEDISAFILSKLLYKKISKDQANFLYEGNGLSLSEKGLMEVKNYKKIINMYVKFDNKLRIIIEQFVLPGLQYKQNKKEAIIKSIKDNLKRSWTKLSDYEKLESGEEIDPKLEYLTNLANNITQIMGGVKPGEQYVINNAKIIVRESGRGITLPSHNFSSDTDFFIRVVDDNLNYEFIPDTNRLRYSYSFATWMSRIANGRVQGLTANLYTTDLRTKVQSKGRLASIIDTFSNGRAISSDENKEEVLPIPDPVVFKNQDQLISAVVNQESAKKFDQRMVVCYNDFLAQNIANLVDTKDVGIIISTTSEKEVEKIIKRFSKGDLKTIITSGRAGYGVDIKKPDGSFPSFHITLINPESQQDIKQGYGRLRAEKNISNFSLLLTEDFLNQLSTNFYEKKPLPLPHFHSVNEFKKALLDYQNDQNKDKFIDLYFELISMNDEKESNDFIYQAELELGFWQKIAPVVSEIKKGIFQKLLDDPDSQISLILNKMLTKIQDKNFVRSQVANELIDFLSLPEESLIQNFFKEASLLKLSPQLYGANNNTLIDNLIGIWYERLVGTKDTYREYYMNILQSGEYIKQELPESIIREKISFYQDISFLIKEQIPFNDIKTEKIERVSITPLPLLKEKIGAKKLINEVDPKKFVKIGVDKYLIVIQNKETHKQSLYLWHGEIPVPGIRIMASMIDTSEVKPGTISKQDVEDLYWVFPNQNNTIEIVTKAILVKYKK